jgi:CheY-like chemotaxis protein
MKDKMVDLLYIEDDASDAEFAKSALSDTGYTNYRLHVIDDGEESLKYLDKSDSYGTAKKPDVILLDLNLPKVHGKDILRHVKASERLKAIPVVVLSTSNHQSEIDETYRLGAAGYFTKPADYQEYQDTFRVICDYWVRKANLPEK